VTNSQLDRQYKWSMQ